MTMLLSPVPHKAEADAEAEAGAEPAAAAD